MLFSKTDIVPKSDDVSTFFDSQFASIKADLCDIANCYLMIAYKVYELDVRIRKDGKKCKYKNIVEACQIELGFKKSTTYNLLNIVKTYAVDDKGQYSYHQLCTYNQYSYSQLVEMLSLGFEQRAEVKPETPVSAIRMLKKSNEKEKQEVFQTSGKSSAAPEPVETFQTSGKSDFVEFSSLKSAEVLKTAIFSDPFDDKLQLQYSICEDDADVFCEFNSDFAKYVDSFTDDLCEFYDTLNPIFTGSDFDTFSPDELEKRFSYIMHVYRSAYNAFKKQQKLKDESAV